MEWQVKLFSGHAFEPVRARHGSAALLAPSNRHDIYRQGEAWHFVGAYTTWRHNTAVQAICLYQCVYYATDDLIALDPHAEAAAIDRVACLAVKHIRMIQTQYLSQAQWSALCAVRHIPPTFYRRDNAEWLLEGQIVHLERADVHFMRPETAQRFWVQHRAGSGEYCGWQSA
ncbi:MAG: hypothetical protein SNJ58_04285 [Aggregatilineales bacterium]